MSEEIDYKKLLEDLEEEIRYNLKNLYHPYMGDFEAIRAEGKEYAYEDILDWIKYRKDHQK
jgi:hypothetical protein